MMVVVSAVVSAIVQRLRTALPGPCFRQASPAVSSAVPVRPNVATLYQAAWFPAPGMRSRIASHFRSDAIPLSQRSLPCVGRHPLPFPFICPCLASFINLHAPVRHKPCRFSNFQTLCHRAKTQVLCFQPNPNSFRKHPGVGVPPHSNPYISARTNETESSTIHP